MAMTRAETQLSVMSSPLILWSPSCAEHAFLQIGFDGRRLMEHLSARGEVLTLAGVSPGSGELHQEF